MPTSGPWRWPQGPEWLAHECWLGPLGEQGRQARVPEADGSQATCGWTWSTGSRQAGRTLGQLLHPACLPLPLRFPRLSPQPEFLEPLLPVVDPLSHCWTAAVLYPAGCWIWCCGKRALSPAPVPVEARRVEEGVVDQCATVSSLRSRSARASMLRIKCNASNHSDPKIYFCVTLLICISGQFRLY